MLSSMVGSINVFHWLTATWLKPASKVLICHGLPATVGTSKPIAASLTSRLTNMQQTNSKKEQRIPLVVSQTGMCKTCGQVYRQEIDDTRKTAVINCEICAVNIEVAALKET